MEGKIRRRCKEKWKKSNGVRVKALTEGGRHEEEVGKVKKKKRESCSRNCWIRGENRRGDENGKRKKEKRHKSAEEQ